MTIRSWYLKLAARHLGRRSHVNEHARIIERTKQMRVELGLGDHRGLREQVE